MKTAEEKREYDRVKSKQHHDTYRSKPGIKEKEAEYAKEYNSRPEIKVRKKQYEKTPERMAVKRKYDSKPEVKERRKEYYLSSIKPSRTHESIEQWRKIYDMYGWECACCGEDNPDFLSLDHINEDGGKERKNGTVAKTYKLALKENDPTKYQILCYNCNMGRSFRGIDGVCPHKLPVGWRFEKTGAMP
jgi:hypothetical protein